MRFSSFFVDKQGEFCREGMMDAMDAAPRICIYVPDRLPASSRIDKKANAQRGKK
jgi:hypothetical protein